MYIIYPSKKLEVFIYADSDPYDEFILGFDVAKREIRDNLILDDRSRKYLEEFVDSMKVVHELDDND